MSHDKANHFTFDDDVCPVCEGIARYARIRQATDDAAREQMKALHRAQPVPPGEPDPADGRKTSIRLMTESEVQQRGGARGGP